MAVTAAIQLGWLGTTGLARGGDALRPGRALPASTRCRAIARGRAGDRPRRSCASSPCTSPARADAVLAATRRRGRPRRAVGRRRSPGTTTVARLRAGSRRRRRRGDRAAHPRRDRRATPRRWPRRRGERAPGGRAASAPLLGRDVEPTIFELSVPGRASFQLRTTGVPATPLADLVPREHLRHEPVALAEVSERDLVGHFTRLSHRQFSVDLGAYPLGSCTMKYNPKFFDEVAARPGLNRVHPGAPAALAQGWLELLVDARGASCARSPACTRPRCSRRPARPASSPGCC